MTEDRELGEVSGALLAGGRSLRMGGRDKCVVELGGKPLFEHALARVRPQVHRIVIIANDDLERFSGYCLPVVPDTVEGHAGPLAGLYTALEWTVSETPEAKYLLTVPVDTPFLPLDLVSRLFEALKENKTSSAVASSGEKLHPVVGLWDAGLIGEVSDALQSGTRAMNKFAEDQKSAVADFPLFGNGDVRIDPFFNINTPEELERAEAIVAVATAE